MQRSRAVFVDLSDFLKVSDEKENFMEPQLKFSPLLPGFLRDQKSLFGKLIGFIWPYEMSQTFNWGLREDFSTEVSFLFGENNDFVFPIICLKDREDPKPLWDLQARFDISLWGSSYFTGVSCCCTFANVAGVSKILSFPFDL